MFLKATYVFDQTVAVELDNGKMIRLLENGFHWKTSIDSNYIVYDKYQTIELSGITGTVTLGKAE